MIIAEPVLCNPVAVIERLVVGVHSRPYRSQCEVACLYELHVCASWCSSGRYIFLSFDVRN